MNMRQSTAVVAGLVLFTGPLPASAQKEMHPRHVKRAPAEPHLGGVPAVQAAEQKRQLRVELARAMPEGANGHVARVDLTPEDIAEIDAPWVTGTPLRIGKVKLLDQAHGVTAKGFTAGAVDQRSEGEFRLGDDRAIARGRGDPRADS